MSGKVSSVIIYNKISANPRALNDQTLLSEVILDQSVCLKKVLRNHKELVRLGSLEKSIQQRLKNHLCTPRNILGGTRE